MNGPVGSPAPAGMVPGWIGSVDLGPRFPRTRGDGPGAVHVGDNGGAVPPHPRGWSLLAELRTTLNRGSPAPAGMVPSSPLIDTGYVRFPRTRGDGPTTRLPRYVGIVVPPHPRGWSPYLRSAFRSPPGSPAPAGMVPSRCSTKASPRWFPRTRGDGPGGAGRGPGGVEVPPHPRGWSLAYAWAVKNFVGSPAPAGMVPEHGTRPQGHSWFPRTRGDGPAESAAARLAAMVPPHPRGWSLVDADVAGQRHGSPAPAGMVPSASPSAILHSRFPRTRGDGPASRSSPASPARVPPHPRGWSPDRGWRDVL